MLANRTFKKIIRRGGALINISPMITIISQDSPQCFCNKAGGNQLPGVGDDHIIACKIRHMG
jgi:hypothetical protein